jgi:hypothetical protein
MNATGAAVGKPFFLWQLPLGNSLHKEDRMLAEINAWRIGSNYGLF